MEKETKRIFKAFFVWQDQNEEEWLREMANKGWMFKKYKLFYVFEKSEPKDVVYKLDFKATKNNDLDEYKAIFRDAGWEHKGQFSNWHYFQTDAKDAAVTPDIYSDVESKIQKYRSLSYQLLITLFSITVLFTMVGRYLSNLDFFKGVYTGLIVILAVAILKVRLNIHKLKKGE